MKSLAAIATLSLLGAIVYSSFAPGESLPRAAALESEPVAQEPRGDDDPANPPLTPLELPELATLEPPQADEDLDALPPEIVLTGRVTPKSGTQPEVTVIAQTQCEPDVGECLAQTYEAQADPATGEFVVEVGPGTWRLVARAQGYLPATEDGLQLSLGEEPFDIVMLLEKGERISGTVVTDGEPLEGVKVVAFNEAWVRTTTTDELGHYAIEGLPPGTYTVQAHSGLVGGDEKQALAGSTVHLNLGHRERVRGRVVDARGMPVEGADIYSDYNPIDRYDTDPLPRSGGAVYGLGAHGCGPSPSCYQRMVTGPDGRFEVEAAVGETITLGARLGSRFCTAEVMPGDETVLELREPLRLRVIDANQNPVAGAEVQLDPQPLFFGQPPPSDAEGFVLVPDFGIESVTPPAELYLAGDVPVRPWAVNKEPPPAEYVIE